MTKTQKAVLVVVMLVYGALIAVSVYAVLTIGKAL